MKLFKIWKYKYRCYRNHQKMQKMLLSIKSSETNQSSIVSQHHHYKRDIFLFSGFVLLLIGGQVAGAHTTHHLRTQEREQVLYQINNLRQKNPLIEADVPKTKRRHSFINEFDQLDAEQPEKYQILPSILIAQAADESNWGNSSLYQEANNAFGVKGSYHGHSITLPTKEVVSGKGKHGKKTQRTVIVHARFKKYPSLRVCVHDHNKMLKNDYLTDGVDTESYISIAKALQHGGYATDRNYANNLIAYVQANNLDRFD